MTGVGGEGCPRCGTWGPCGCLGVASAPRSAKNIEPCPYCGTRLFARDAGDIVDTEEATNRHHSVLSCREYVFTAGQSYKGDAAQLRVRIEQLKGEIGRLNTKLGRATATLCVDCGQITAPAWVDRCVKCAVAFAKLHPCECGHTGGANDPEGHEESCPARQCCVELGDAKNRLRAAEESLRVEREYSNRLYSLRSGYQDPPAPPARP